MISAVPEPLLDEETPPISPIRRPAAIRPLSTANCDFLCVGAKLIVEADGAQHAERPRDETRDAYLARRGWTVLRFWNHEVIQNCDGVLATVLARGFAMVRPLPALTGRATRTLS